MFTWGGSRHHIPSKCIRTTQVLLEHRRAFSRANVRSRFGRRALSLSFFRGGVQEQSLDNFQSGATASVVSHQAMALPNGMGSMIEL